MLGEMSVKKEVFTYLQAIPSSLKEKFSSGEFDVKALFAVSELSWGVLKRRSPKTPPPRQKQRLPEGNAF